MPLTSPALEFVKSVIKVISLDSNVTLQTNKLKRDLLRLIGFGEFSPCSHFKDPCLSYVLPEVICKTCNHVRDVDLCRDPYLSNDTPGATWACIQCETEYDVLDIEHSLIEVVNRKSMAYTLQDLKCVKCGGVKDNNMQSYCSCACNFENSMSRDNFLLHMKTFHSIASHYKMRLLLETVDWVLKMNN